MDTEDWKDWEFPSVYCVTELIAEWKEVAN
jgi:hypothetical protein